MSSTVLAIGFGAFGGVSTVAVGVFLVVVVLAGACCLGMFEPLVSRYQLL